MSESDDKDSKTEEPTGKRSSEALSKGQVPNSTEVNHAVSLTITCVIVLALSGGIMLEVKKDMLFYLEQPHTVNFEGKELIGLFMATALSMLGVLAWPFILFVVGAILGARAQHPFVFSTESIGFNFAKLSPIKGLSNLVSPNNIREFGKSMLKMLILVPTIGLVLMNDVDKLPSLVSGDITLLLNILYDMLVKVFLVLLPVVILIAAADYYFKWSENHDNLKMTKQEVKDEYKQTEGSPEVKAKLRQIRFEKFRQRIAQAVPRADVVITNPTHYAIALEYDPDGMGAPKVTAKGADHIAARIRELAEQYDVPLVANPPLARTLYSSVDIDQEIQPEHYEAVAKVISYVLQLPGRIADKEERQRRAEERARGRDAAVKIGQDIYKKSGGR